MRSASSAVHRRRDTGRVLVVAFELLAGVDDRALGEPEGDATLRRVLAGIVEPSDELSGLMNPEPPSAVARRPGASKSKRILAFVPASEGSNHGTDESFPRWLRRRLT